MFDRRKLNVVLIVILFVGTFQLVRLGYLVRWSELSGSELLPYERDRAVDFIPGMEEEWKRQGVRLIGTKTRSPLYDEMEALLDSANVLESQHAEDIIVTEPLISKIPIWDILLEDVKDGADMVFVALPDTFLDPLYPAYAQTMGIQEQGRVMSVDSIRLASSVLLGEKERAYQDLPAFDVTVLQLTQNATVLADTEDGLPLMWLVPYGDGSIRVVNAGVISRLNRGLVLAALCAQQELLVYPVLDVDVLLLEEFPTPLAGESQRIRASYGRTIERFFSEIFWPDGLALCKVRGLSSTAGTISGYEQTVDEEVGERLISQGTLSAYGREIVRHDGELGVSGYNQTALAGGDSSARLLEAARQHFESVFHNYALQSYIPPDGYWEEGNEEALLEVSPEMQCVVGSFFPAEGIPAQDFSVGGRLVMLPRTIQGFDPDDGERLRAELAALELGARVQAVRPEEALYQDWEQLAMAFEASLDKNREAVQFGNQTAVQAAQQVKQKEAGRLYFRQLDDLLEFAYDGYLLTQGILVHTEKNLQKPKNCMVQRVDEDTWLIRMQKSRASVEVTV